MDGAGKMESGKARYEWGEGGEKRHKKDGLLCVAQ